MKRRRLGRSGIEVSRIGFGAWGIGGATPGATSYGRTDDAVSLRALRAALDEGINFFDTSSVYGYGHSEELIGRAVLGRRADAVIATKVGLTQYGEVADFSPHAIKKSLHGSLKRLNSDYVDLLQLHNPPAEFMENCDEMAALADDLKREGLIRAFGVSVRAPGDGAAAMAALSLDAIQVNFNLLDQRAIDCGLLDTAQIKNCALIARTPLCFGFLGGDVNAETVFANDDHRSRWSQAQIARWARGASAMRDVMEPDLSQTPAQFALRYCLSFEAVASVIPGILTVDEVHHNAGADRLDAIGSDTLEKIREVYQSWESVLEAPDDPGKAQGEARS